MRIWSSLYDGAVCVYLSESGAADVADSGAWCDEAVVSSVCSGCEVSYAAEVYGIAGCVRGVYASEAASDSGGESAV